MRKGVDCIGVTAVFLCHDGDGNFVLSKRSENCRDEHGRWDPGGGSVEFGDSVIETLKREVEEEYCAEVLEYEFLGYRDVHREVDGEPTHWIGLDFKVRVDPDEVENGEPHKLERIGWFSLEDLPEPLHSQFPDFLERYEDKL